MHPLRTAALLETPDSVEDPYLEALVVRLVTLGVAPRQLVGELFNEVPSSRAQLVCLDLRDWTGGDLNAIEGVLRWVRDFRDRLGQLNAGSGSLPYFPRLAALGEHWGNADILSAENVLCLGPCATESRSRREEDVVKDALRSELTGLVGDWQAAKDLGSGNVAAREGLKELEESLQEWLSRSAGTANH